MRSDVLNSNSSSFGNVQSSELGGVKKVLTFAGDCKESRLDSATTAYADNDIIQYMGAFDTSVPAGYNDAIKIVVTKVLFVCKTATGTAMTGSIAAGTAANEAVNGDATEADKINFNSANNCEWAAPHIVLPAATKYLYMRTNTAINHATNFDAGRWSVVVEYVLV